MPKSYAGLRNPPLDEIIRRKSQERLCPNCMRLMAYRPLPRHVRNWSPSHYGWNCDGCAFVWELDGDWSVAPIFDLTERGTRTKEIYAAYAEAISPSKRQAYSDVPEHGTVRAKICAASALLLMNSVQKEKEKQCLKKKKR